MNEANTASAPSTDFKLEAPCDTAPEHPTIEKLRDIFANDMTPEAWQFVMKQALAAMVNTVHENARSKGWWDTPTGATEMLADLENPNLILRTTNISPEVPASESTEVAEIECDRIKGKFAKWLRETALERNFGEAIALIHSEASEALEFRRAWKDKKQPRPLDDKIPLPGEVVELADVVIRVLDLVGGLGDRDTFVTALFAKHEYNKSRPVRHGKSF